MNTKQLQEMRSSIDSMNRLQEMLEIHGIRGVIDMISAMCKDNAKQGKTMAYNSEKDYNLLPDTLLQIADNLDKDLW